MKYIKNIEKIIKILGDNFDIISWEIHEPKKLFGYVPDSEKGHCIKTRYGNIISLAFDTLYSDNDFIAEVIIHELVHASGMWEHDNKFYNKFNLFMKSYECHNQMFKIKNIISGRYFPASYFI